MGVRELREAFNAAGAPGFVAQKAFLEMTRVENVEMTILKFYGIGPDGTPFEVSSDPLPAGADVNLAAGEVARKMIAGLSQNQGDSS